ncbi:unnamed protein product [Adineta ricciae]|uniref:RNase H type-1 domain-containing protein n=1 Tax=Adineta ricciae TaxID=249248 RepID=A0A814LCH3_ADIRI|nr:unnamed protein product [Adineta ricciae]
MERFPIFGDQKWKFFKLITIQDGECGNGYECTINIWPIAFILALFFIIFCGIFYFYKRKQRRHEKPVVNTISIDGRLKKALVVFNKEKNSKTQISVIPNVFLRLQRTPHAIFSLSNETSQCIQDLEFFNIVFLITIFNLIRFCRIPHNSTNTQVFSLPVVTHRKTWNDYLYLFFVLKSLNNGNTIDVNIDFSPMVKTTETSIEQKPTSTEERELVCFCDGSYSHLFKIGYSGFRTSSGTYRFRFLSAIYRSTDTEVLAAYLAIEYALKHRFAKFRLYTDNSKVKQLFQRQTNKDVTRYADFCEILQLYKQNYGEDAIDVIQVRGHTTRSEQMNCKIKREFARIDRFVRRKTRQHIRRCSNELTSSFYSKLNVHHENLQTFHDINLCIDYIKSHSSETIILVVSASLALKLVPEVYGLSSISMILMFCTSIDNDTKWTKEFSDKLLMFDEEDDLLERLWLQIEEYFRKQAKQFSEQADQYKQRAKKLEQSCG